MSGNTTKVNSEESNIAFESYHLPSLQAGLVSLDTKVSFDLSGHIKKDFSAPTLNLFVAGPRFLLQPNDLHAVFPPRDSFGEYDNVLPHVELNNSTLPWQRKTGSSDKTVPWLGLILLEADETADAAKVTMTSSPWQNLRKKLTLTEEKLTDVSDNPNKPFPPVKILHLQEDFLRKIMPSADDLKWLTHVRVGHDKDGKETERSIIVCNRMPRPGIRSVVHLVSFEERFTKEGFDFSKGKEEGKIPFLSLHSWQFTCPDSEQYKVSSEAVERLEDPLRKKAREVFSDEELREVLHRGREEFRAFLNDLGFTTLQDQNKFLAACHIQTETFKGLMDALDWGWLHLTKSGEESAKSGIKMLNQKMSKASSVPMAHGLRGGGKTVSWYRGPLTADPHLSQQIEATLLRHLPVRNSDQLLMYNKTNQMLDTSYAAAWEVGRLLSVSDPKISRQIAQWKTSHAREVALVEQNLLFSHIPFTDSEFIHRQETRVESNLQSYFTDLSLLKGVPFHYLIPHNDLLPDESLRFFHIDSLWIECLLDGAFSIGRTTKFDRKRERDESGNLEFPHKKERGVRTGVLLRSDLVSGWPSLMAEGYAASDSTGNPLPVLRFEKLGPNILMMIFDGNIRSFTLHLPPESLHFGFNRPIDKEKKMFKEIKDENGDELKNSDGSNKTTQITWKQENKKDSPYRIFDAKRFAENLSKRPELKVKHSGELSIQLLEGVPKLSLKFAEN